MIEALASFIFDYAIPITLFVTMIAVLWMLVANQIGLRNQQNALREQYAKDFDDACRKGNEIIPKVRKHESQLKNLSGDFLELHGRFNALDSKDNATALKGIAKVMAKKVKKGVRR